MTLLQTVSSYCGMISGILTLCILLIKPIREKLIDRSAEREGIRCVLRDRMLSIYYKHREEKQIRQYEKELFVLHYKAYKAMGGNSFIDDIYAEIRTWEVIS